MFVIEFCNAVSVAYLFECMLKCYIHQVQHCHSFQVSKYNCQLEMELYLQITVAILPLFE